jgi:hypothetical protein
MPFHRTTRRTRHSRSRKIRGGFFGFSRIRNTFFNTFSTLKHWATSSFKTTPKSNMIIIDPKNVRVVTNDQNSNYELTKDKLERLKNHTKNSNTKNHTKNSNLIHVRDGNNPNLLNRHKNAVARV